MPVPLVKSGKRPFHGRPCQPRLHMRIAGDVSIVVIIEEPVMTYGVVEHKHNGGQQQTEQQCASCRRLKLVGGSQDSRSFDAFRNRGRGRRTHECNDSEPDTKDSRRKAAIDSSAALGRTLASAFLASAAFRSPADSAFCK